MATSGNVWLTMKTGTSARRAGWKKSMTMERMNATVSEKAKPVSVAATVGTALSSRTCQLTTIWVATRDGAGKVVGLMPE